MKTIEEIYERLAADFQQQTGLTAGGSGDLAVRFYAVAAQLYGLYAQADWTGRQCFPQTAVGEWLDHHAQLRGIRRGQAVPAVGTVRFFAGEDRLKAAEIPAGTVCMTAVGQRYVTVEDGTIPLGETQLDLTVEAVETGAEGNAAAGNIVYLALPPAGITACTNPAALTGGRDSEDDETLRQRVLASYHRLANGANAAFYQQAALAYDGVAAAVVLPRNRGVGTVDLVVTAQGGLPDQTLLDGLQAQLNSQREIAVDVQVTAPQSVEADIDVVLTVEAGREFETVSAAVEHTLRSWFTGKLLGCPVLQAQLTALVFAVDGVANCAVTLSGGDLAADSITLPCLGQLTVTQA